MWVKDIPANPPPGLSVRTENQGRIFYQLLTHMGLKQNAQAFTGAPKQRSNTYPHVNAAWDLADRIGVTKNPLNLKKLETITEKPYSDIIAEVSTTLSPPPYHRLRRWDFNTSPIQDSNTVASTSKIVEVEETPNLLERFTSLKVSDKEAKVKHQREKCRWLALEKRFQKSLSKGKGKEKELVHPKPSSPIAPDIGNIRVFEETPVEERLNWGTVKLSIASPKWTTQTDSDSEAFGVSLCAAPTHNAQCLNLENCRLSLGCTQEQNRDETLGGS